MRPAPVEVVGKVLNYNFDLKKCEFTLRIQAGTVVADAPTVVLLPDYHFPNNTSVVEVTSGKWEISSDDDDGVLLQKLKWWHGEGEQTLKVTGLVRRHNYVEGVSEEPGYYDQLGNAISNCSIM